MFRSRKNRGALYAAITFSRFRNRRKAPLLASGLVAALFTVPVQAQTNTNPDFSNENDILHGKRTLLQTTDVEIATGDHGVVSLIFLPSSNSSLGPLTQGDIRTPAPKGKTLFNFSGRLYNQPEEATISAVDFTPPDRVNHIFAYAITLGKISSSFDILTQVNGSGGALTNGVVADFTGDGYDDLAFSFDDGSLQIATASQTAYFDPINGGLKFGPHTVTFLTPLAALAAGDFKGDRHHEIAGLSFDVGTGGLQLLIYTGIASPSTYSLPLIWLCRMV
jgi:hypothetical protein